MSPQEINRRRIAVKTADAINKIEGAAVSTDARILSEKWVRGELTGAQMKAALISKHTKVNAQRERLT